MLKLLQHLKSHSAPFLLQFEYRLSQSELRQRTLQVTVWSAEMTGNEFLGAIHLSLSGPDLHKESTEWHKLSALHRMKS